MERWTVRLVAVGGFAGAVCRYAVSVALPATFPWGTLAVNVAGAFLLGVVVYGTAELRQLPKAARLVVATGFLSSFTTYSTFAAETTALSPVLAAANVVANYALGFLAVVLATAPPLWRERRRGSRARSSPRRWPPQAPATARPSRRRTYCRW